MVTELVIKNLGLSFDGSPVLEGVSFSFSGGHIVALLGPNGAGKSTLLRAIDGILHPNSGEILLNGHDVAALSPRELARQIAYVPQRDEQLRPMSVFDAVLLGRMPHFGFRPRLEDYEKVAEVLERFELQELAHRDLLELSGGQRQRVMIARSLAQQPRLLLIDEPTANLDIKYQLELVRILHQEVNRLGRDRSLLVLVAIHDLNLALRLADRFLLLSDGKLAAQGPPEALDEETLRAVFEVNVQRLKHHGRPWLLIES